MSRLECYYLSVIHRLCDHTSKSIAKMLGKILVMYSYFLAAYFSGKIKLSEIIVINFPKEKNNELALISMLMYIYGKNTHSWARSHY